MNAIQEEKIMFNLDTLDHDKINELRDCFVKAGFNQENTEKRLAFKFGNAFTAFAPTLLFPLFKLILTEHEPSQADWILLNFYCHYPVPTIIMRQILGEALYQYLLKVEFFTLTEETVLPVVQIIPFGSLLIATDPPVAGNGGVNVLDFSEKAVMTLFPDSYDLARRIDGIQASTALDVFCGNGIHALLLSRQVEKVIGIDVNPKAIEIARFNARLNDIHNVEFIEHNVKHSMESLGKFDFVVANPPFVPAPTQRTLFCDGGEQGDTFVRLFIAERLPELVKETTKVCMLFTLVRREGETTIDKLTSYRNDAFTYQTTIEDLTSPGTLSPLHTFLVYFLASRHMDDFNGYEAELASFYEMFKSLGMKDLSYNFVTLEGFQFIKTLTFQR